MNGFGAIKWLARMGFLVKGVALRGRRRIGPPGRREGWRALGKLDRHEWPKEPNPAAGATTKP